MPLGKKIGIWAITWKTIKKHVQAQFTKTWTSIAISRVDDHFHHDFQMGFQEYPHRYMGVSLGCTTSKSANKS